MGHTEMVLAVAGLDEQADRRAGRSGWPGATGPSFPPAERVAFRFAHKQAERPGIDRAADVRPLVDYFGPERALDVVWWACRCHYMTCVADAFQLPLEEQNVFDGFPPRPSPPGKRVTACSGLARRGVTGRGRPDGLGRPPVFRPVQTQENAHDAASDDRSPGGGRCRPADARASRASG